MVDMTNGEGTLGMTMRVLTTKITNHDKERNSKVYRAADCFDCIGDTDGTGGYLVHGGISPSKKRAGSVKTSSFLFLFIMLELV